ncbi:MAG: ABC transporter ATP-binding protein [Pseudomonadota bacterium]
MNALAVEFRAIGMSFGTKVAVKDINLSVQRGDYVVLLGPSGGGKTTLLNILGGFLTPTAGRVLIDGADVTDIAPAKRPTTTVFQDYALFPHMTVAGNVGFGLKMQSLPKAEQSPRIAQALEMVGLAHLAGRRIHELSGGQRQRIALARALAVEPTVLLLDEPLGALDMKLRRQMQEELKAIQKRVGTTFVHVTHDQEEAMAIADVIVVMNDGFIEDLGPPERIYLRPASRFTATFMGESNLFDGKVTAVNGDRLTVEAAFGQFEITGPGEEGQEVCLVVRPEHLSSSSDENRSGRQLLLGQGRIEETGFFGTHHQCLVQLAGHGALIRLRLPQRAAPQIGDSLELFADPSDIAVVPR